MNTNKNEKLEFHTSLRNAKLFVKDDENDGEKKSTKGDIVMSVETYCGYDTVKVRFFVSPNGITIKKIVVTITTVEKHKFMDDEYDYLVTYHGVKNFYENSEESLDVLDVYALIYDAYKKYKSGDEYPLQDIKLKFNIPLEMSKMVKVRN